MIFTDFTSTYIKFRKKEDVRFLINYKTHCKYCNGEFDHKDINVNDIFLSIEEIYEKMSYMGGIRRHEKCESCGSLGLEYCNISIALHNQNNDITSTYVEFGRKEDVRFLIKYKGHKVFYSIEEIYEKISCRNGEIIYQEYSSYEKGVLEIFDIGIALYNQNEETEWDQLSYG